MRRKMKQMVKYMVSNTHTERMQTHGPLLPLLLGEDVLWKLMDGCKETHQIKYSFILYSHQLYSARCKESALIC